MGIIKFESKEKVRESILKKVEKDVDDYIDDITNLISSEEYGERLQEKLSGIVVIIDFENKQTTTQSWITDENLNKK